jgi:5'-deoxynucleotidase YfbR-like HD superfamily hydrolase
LDPDPAEVDARDIAHALSNICRFSGHVREFYSVAEHCIRVSLELPPDLALAGLLHDASEAYLVDVPRPLKPALEGYQIAEDRLMFMLAGKFGFPWPMPEPVRQADERLLVMEARALINGPLDEWELFLNHPHDAVHAPVCEALRRPMDPKVAEKAFLRRLQLLMRTEARI